MNELFQSGVLSLEAMFASGGRKARTSNVLTFSGGSSERAGSHRMTRSCSVSIVRGCWS